MAKMSTDDLLDAFKEMTLIELSEFVKSFEDTFDVKAAAPMAMAGPAAGGGGAAAEEVEEQDEFDVILEAAGDKKIQVIKEVRPLMPAPRPVPLTRLIAEPRARPIRPAPPRRDLKHSGMKEPGKGSQHHGEDQ